LQKLQVTPGTFGTFRVQLRGQCSSLPPPPSIQIVLGPTIHRNFSSISYFSVTYTASKVNHSAEYTCWSLSYVSTPGASGGCPPQPRPRIPPFAASFLMQGAFFFRPQWLVSQLLLTDVVLASRLLLLEYSVLRHTGAPSHCNS